MKARRHSEQNCEDFDKPNVVKIFNLNKFVDLKLTFVDGQIEMCKTVLCTNSVIFYMMLTQNFRKKDAAETRLFGDSYSQMLALMKAIHPPLLPNVLNCKMKDYRFSIGLKII